MNYKIIINETQDDFIYKSVCQLDNNQDVNEYLTEVDQANPEAPADFSFKVDGVRLKLSQIEELTNDIRSELVELFKDCPDAVKIKSLVI
tara:strand:- start:37 stop:306 length:270 start_codon:yes stop_codon:yes gene_type:complete